MSKVILKVIKVARFSHESVFVLSVFAYARFFASGSRRDGVIGNGLQQCIASLPGLLAARGAPEGPLPLLQSVHRAFKRQRALCLERTHGGRADHQMTHEVVSDHVHEQLTRHHVRCLAAQCMHVKTGLDVIKVEFHLPALTIPGGDLRCRVDAGVTQRGDDLQLLRAKAGAGAAHVDQSQIQRGWQRRVHGRRRGRRRGPAGGRRARR